MDEQNHLPKYIEHKDADSVVLFIHGFMGGPRQFDRLSQLVYDHGFSASCVLLPGHGVSLKDFSSSTYRSWIKSVSEELDRLEKKYKNIWIVGHSMGGLLALCLAIYPTANIRGVLAIASPFELTILSKNDIKVRLTQVLKSEEHYINQEYIGKSSVPRTPSVIFRSLAPMIEVKKLIRYTRANLGILRAPVKAIYSISDELISIKSLEILKTGLKKSHFEYVVLTDSLHSYYTEEEKLIIDEELLEFILK